MSRYGANVRTQSTNGFSPKNNRLQLGTAAEVLPTCWRYCETTAVRPVKGTGMNASRYCTPAANLLPTGREIVILLFRQQQIAMPPTGKPGSRWWGFIQLPRRFQAGVFNGRGSNFGTLLEPSSERSCKPLPGLARGILSYDLRRCCHK